MDTCFLERELERGPGILTRGSVKVKEVGSFKGVVALDQRSTPIIHRESMVGFRLHVSSTWFI